MVVAVPTWSTRLFVPHFPHSRPYCLLSIGGRQPTRLDSRSQWWCCGTSLRYRYTRWESGPIKTVAIVAGVFTLFGQIRLLAPLLMVANAAYNAWYVGIGRRFWRARRH